MDRRAGEGGVRRRVLGPARRGLGEKLIRLFRQSGARQDAALDLDQLGRGLLSQDLVQYVEGAAGRTGPSPEQVAEVLVRAIVQRILALYPQPSKSPLEL